MTKEIARATDSPNALVTISEGETIPLPQPVPGRPPVVRSALFGYLVLLFGLGGFTIWTATAPLSSAAIAPGVIAVDTSRKVVQHLEGGIISELLVREGDTVAAGQVLVRLDDLEARSTHDLLESEYVALTAQQSRLAAERDELEVLSFPQELVDLRHSDEVDDILTSQERIFQAGRTALQGQIDSLGQQIAQLYARISAFEAQLASGTEQLTYIGEESAGVRELLRIGLERKPRLLALQRQSARIRGEQGDLRGRIAEAREGIAEAEMEIINLKRTRIEKAALELREIEQRRTEVAEKLAAAKIKLGRREVIAPQAGKVFNLQYHTIGGVVSPGATIMEIVPEKDRLIVEAQVSPTDMDVVHPGLSAKVTLTAYKHRTTPQLNGIVEDVSADALTDERTGRAYFEARILIEAEELARIEGGKLVPGMPADAFIETGERTVLDYLIQPIVDSFRSAFKES